MIMGTVSYQVTDDSDRDIDVESTFSHNSVSSYRQDVTGPIVFVMVNAKIPESNALVASREL